MSDVVKTPGDRDEGGESDHGIRGKPCGNVLAARDPLLHPAPESLQHHRHMRTASREAPAFSRMLLGDNVADGLNTGANTLGDFNPSKRESCPEAPLRIRPEISTTPLCGHGSYGVHCLTYPSVLQDLSGNDPITADRPSLLMAKVCEELHWLGSRTETLSNNAR